MSYGEWKTHAYAGRAHWFPPRHTPAEWAACGRWCAAWRPVRREDGHCKACIAAEKKFQKELVRQ